MSCCCTCLDTQVEFSYIYTSPCEFLSIINISGLFCVENAYRRSECPRSISARYQKLNDIFFGSFVKKLKDTNDYFNNILILFSYLYKNTEKHCFKKKHYSKGIKLVEHAEIKLKY